MYVSKEIAGRQGRKGLKVVFTSDKKRTGGGAQCTAQCIDPAPTTTPTPGTVQSLKFEFSSWDFYQLHSQFITEHYTNTSTSNPFLCAADFFLRHTISYVDVR